jgi:pSer/pThr/pTyr-binding forkhead associated (FHA) protein
VPPSGPTRPCTNCTRQTPAAFAFCQHCGTRLGVVVVETDIGEVSVADTLGGDMEIESPLLAPPPGEEIVPLVKKRSVEPAPAAAPEPGVYARLISVLRDGTDGQTHHLGEDLVDVGRREGTLVFEDDKFLAPRHARFERRAGAVVLTPLDTTNGVYVRVRQGEVLPVRDGDQILLGKEVLRFEVLEPEERGQLPAVQHGVRLFGSPMRTPWARLRQIVQSGVARDIYHLGPPEVVIGREEGDLRFPDDEFMSRRHARLTNRDGKFELIDLESSNGTYVRLRGERVLKAGDLVRIGDQLFRFLPTSA